jgi:hypothetical protein
VPGARASAHTARSGWCALLEAVAAVTMVPGDAESPLAGLRRRLEARRSLLAQEEEREEEEEEGTNAPRTSGAAGTTGGGSLWREAAGEQEQETVDEDQDEAHQQQQEQELTLADLVTYNASQQVGASGLQGLVGHTPRCRPARADPMACMLAAPLHTPHDQVAAEDPETTARLFLQFARDTWGRATPSAPRAAADAARRVPEEELGLFMPTQPRVRGCQRSHASLVPTKCRGSRMMRMQWQDEARQQEHRACAELALSTRRPPGPSPPAPGQQPVPLQAGAATRALSLHRTRRARTPGVHGRAAAAGRPAACGRRGGRGALVVWREWAHAVGA